MSGTDLIGIPESAIALLAHPDDPEFMAGGTIARWTAAGCQVSYVIMTDGRAGSQGLSPDDPMSEAELVQRRREEQVAAGAVLGVREEDIVFLDYHDGELFHTLRFCSTRNDVCYRATCSILITGPVEKRRWRPSFRWLRFAVPSLTFSTKGSNRTRSSTSIWSHRCSQT
jgi:LmbE family N-acetylglucosaminyl deacetylase